MIWLIQNFILKDLKIRLFWGYIGLHPLLVAPASGFPIERGGEKVCVHYACLFDTDGKKIRHSLCDLRRGKVFCTIRT